MVDVSIVIPVYNGEDTIKRCIDSVLSQTLENIELIVVNDGSTDSTEKIIKEYDDSRIKLITIENSGQGFARNIGIDEAVGRYVGFVDADDTVSEDMYEVMYTLAKTKNADVVQCAINDIKAMGCSVRPEQCDEYVEITDIGEYTDQYFYTMKHTNEVCNKIFLRSFLNASGLRFSDTKKIFSEDLKFNIELLQKMKNIGFLEKPFYNYYISDEGHCRTQTPDRVKKILELYVQVMKEIKNSHVKKAVKSMAVVNVMSYAVPVIDDVREIISSKTLKKFMLTSCFYKKTFRHTMLMLALVVLPYALKKKFAIKYYTF